VKRRISWNKSSFGREPPFIEDLGLEAVEKALLGPVGRKSLVKTMKTGNDFAGAVVICYV
jgi:hypothetical protein